MKIKKCPFCGGDARLVEHRYLYGRDRRYGIRCEACKAESAPNYATMQAALDAWNKRTEERNV